jgi:hypothetical protein
MADVAYRRMPLRPEKSHFTWLKSCQDRLRVRRRDESGRLETRLLGRMLGFASARLELPHRFEGVEAGAVTTMVEWQSVHVCRAHRSR